MQGGIVPVAAGYALGNKLKNNGAIGIVFIGDGTLGEGVLYETMNIISKWNIPFLVVCENNFYAQSTPQSVNLAGDILLRAAAFDIRAAEGTYQRTRQTLMEQAVRSNCLCAGTGKAIFLPCKYVQAEPAFKRR